MLLTGEDRSTRRKTCPKAILSTTNPTRIALRPKPDISGDKTGSSRLNRGDFWKRINVTNRFMPNREILSPRYLNNGHDKHERKARVYSNYNNHKSTKYWYFQLYDGNIFRQDEVRATCWQETVLASLCASLDTIWLHFTQPASAMNISVSIRLLSLRTWPSCCLWKIFVPLKTKLVYQIAR